MYPRLSDLIQDVFGVYIPLPIQSYGFMMAIAFIVGAVITYYEMKRKEEEGIFLPIYLKEKIGEPAKASELIISLVVGFLIGFKLFAAIKNYDAFVANPQYFLVSKEGSFTGGLLIGIISMAYTWWDKNRKKLDQPRWIARKIMPHDLIGNMIVIAGVWGLIGAKIFHILAHIPDEFLVDPWGTIFSFGGLAFYGGLIFGFVAIMLYLKKYNVNLLHATDIAAVVLPITYAIGRIGCQISGDGCWGIPNPKPKPDWLSFLPDWMWSFDYPHNVLGAAGATPEWGIHVEKIAGCTGEFCYKLATPVYPTPFYETTIMFIVFLILWFMRKKVKRPGILFSWYLIFAGIERFFIEFIRHTTRYHFLGISATQAQIISVIMFVAGVAGLIFIYRKPQVIDKWAEVKPKEINLPPKDMEIVEGK